MRKAEKKQQAFANSLTMEYIRKLAKEVDKLRADVNYLDFKVEELETYNTRQDECLCEPEPKEKPKHNWVKLGDFLDVFVDKSRCVELIVWHKDRGEDDEEEHFWYTIGKVADCYAHANVINVYVRSDELFSIEVEI